MLDERLAKEKLEDEAGIYFEYSRARYDESTKLWTFSITEAQGKRVFRATFKEDFAPYIALSKYLKIPFQKCISYYVWIYGDEIELIPNEEQHKFCYTKKGWIAVSEIIKAFTEKYGTYAKDNLLQDVTWKLVIDKNECSSSTYKKSENPSWPNINTKVSLDLNQLEDKVVKTESSNEQVEKKVDEESEKSETFQKKDVNIQPVELSTVQPVINSFQSKKQDITQLKPSQYKVAELTSPENSINVAKTNEVKTHTTEATKISNSKKYPFSIKNKKLSSKIKVVFSNKKWNKVVPILLSVASFIALIGFGLLLLIFIFFIARNKYTITFNTGNGKAIRVSAKQGELFKLLDENSASRKGYVLIGWTVNPSSTKPYENCMLAGTHIEMKKNYHNTIFYPVWGQEMYVNSDGLNMRSTPIYYKNDSNKLFALSRGDRVIMFEDCYQGDDNLWAPVVAINPDTNKKQVVFASITRLDYFYINDLLFGNQYRDGNIITSAETSSNLDASSIRFLNIKASVKCAKDRNGKERFHIVIKRRNAWGNIYVFGEYRWTAEVDDLSNFISLGGFSRNIEGSYSPGKYYIDVIHKNKINPKCSEITIASKKIILN